MLAKKGRLCKGTSLKTNPRRSRGLTDIEAPAVRFFNDPHDKPFDFTPFDSLNSLMVNRTGRGG